MAVMLCTHIALYKGKEEAQCSAADPPPKQRSRYVSSLFEERVVGRHHVQHSDAMQVDVAM
jgi:hypothetical protein